MAKYRRVTGKILSRDSYREDRWNPEKVKYEECCVYTMRVEYTVRGKIYTHNFASENICGEVGDNYEFLYLNEDPEIVKEMTSEEGKAERRKSGGFKIVILATALILICILIYLVFINRCSIRNIPSGHSRSEEYSQMAGFQDYTDFCIYYYDSAGDVESDPDYKVMTQEDAEKIRGYFENMEQFLDSEKLQEKCSAAEECISEGDYYLIDTREGETKGDFTYGEYDNYSVWYFDVESTTLYFIHNNT